MATPRRIRAVLRRLGIAALEDFGLKPHPGLGAPADVAPIDPGPHDEVAADGPVLAVAGPGASDLDALPPGVVWRGSAPRSVELQRFVEHLDAVRATAHAARF